MIYLGIVIIIICCYFIGNINFARIIAWKRKNQDITTKGSFNPGTMNMLRVYGLKVALTTMFLEFIKGGIPALISALIMDYFFPGMFYIIYFMAGISAVIGQILPAIYKFKGGKGLATCAGVFFFSPLWWLGIILFFICCVELYYVDIASVATLTYITCMGIAMTIYITVFNEAKLYWAFSVETISCWWISLILMWGMIGIVYIAHKKNIYKLFHKSENKIGFAQKVKEFFNRNSEKVEIEKQEENEQPEKEIIIEDEKENK